MITPRLFERLPMISVHPDSATREDIAELAAELMETRRDLLASQAEVATLRQLAECCGATADTYLAGLEREVEKRERVEAEVATLRTEREQYRVQVEERYGAVAQWQNEAETNRQAWLKAQAEVVTLRQALEWMVNVACGEEEWMDATKAGKEALAAVQASPAPIGWCRNGPRWAGDCCFQLWPHDPASWCEECREAKWNDPQEEPTP